MFGWLGCSSFSSLHMEYRSIYYMTRNINPHSYIGIQPARTGGKLRHAEQAVGINHIALWARGKKEIDRFHRDFLLTRDVLVTDEPKGAGWVPKVPTLQQMWSFYRAIRGFAKSRADLASTVPAVMRQASRTLPGR
ncbi:hypothetical protein SKC41_13625 [Mycobacterium sp. 050128]|uniref:hypothetical protein n=1 Tax=Mycobacterium sp. 050128 TaxID=3096112 RepID=UPI002ED8AFB3